MTALFVAERAEKAYGWVTDTTEVREAARDTLDALQDAERGQPGYLLTGNPNFLTTGFTRNAIVHNGMLDADVHLLNKPYTQQDLGKKSRELRDLNHAAKKQERLIVCRVNSPTFLPIVKRRWTLQPMLSP